MPVKSEKELSGASLDMWKRANSAITANNSDYAIELFKNLLKIEPALLAARQKLRVIEIQKFKAQSGMSKQMVGVKSGPMLMKATGLAKKNPTEALVAAEDILTIDPYSAKANEMLAEAALGLNLPEIASLAYEIIAEGKPEDKEVFRQLAKHYQSIKEWKKAENALERLLQADSRDGDAMSALKNVTAQIASIAGKWEEKGDFRDSLRDKGQSAALEQTGRVVKSVDAVREQIEQLSEKANAEPANLNWPKQIGALYAQIEEYDSAVQWYEYAYNAGNQMDGALEKIASDLKLKKLDKEIESYSDAAEQDPATYKEYFDSLVAQRKQVILETAKQRVIRYPMEFEYQFQLGKALVDLTMFKEALQPLQAGSKSPAVRTDALNLIGYCQWQRNMLDMAEKTYTNTANEIPIMNELKKEIIYNLGCVLEAAGKKEFSIEKFKEIYEVDMSYKDVAKRVEDSYGI